MNTNEIKQELERGYKVFKAFESGLAVIQEIDTLEARKDQANKELQDVYLQTDAARKELDKAVVQGRLSLEDIATAVTTAKEKADAELAEYVASHEVVHGAIQAKEMLAQSRVDALNAQADALVAENIALEDESEALKKFIAEQKEKLNKTLGSL